MAYLQYEQVDGILQGQFKDVRGNNIVASQLLTLTWTLYNREDSAIINSIEAVDILNANGGTISDSGLLSLHITNEDNEIINATGQDEVHICLFEFTFTMVEFGVTVLKGKQEVELIVKNLLKVTTPVEPPPSP